MNKRNLATALPNRIKKKREFFEPGVNQEQGCPRDSPSECEPEASSYSLPFSLSPMGFMSPPGDNLFPSKEPVEAWSRVWEEEIFSGPAKLVVQPVAIAFNQSPDEVFLSPRKTGDSASLVGIYSKETLRYSSTVAALIFMV
jgi:hypothetical protein